MIRSDRENKWGMEAWYPLAPLREIGQNKQGGKSNLPMFVCQEVGHGVRSL